jgi:recombination protein RecA
MAKESKDKDNDVAMKNLKGFIKKGSEIDIPNFTTTGHFALDLAIAHGVSPDNTEFDVSELDSNNIGGFPQGKLVEVSGSEGSGKSSLCYRVVGYAQKKGLKCMWIDAEQSFSHDLAAINGVDTDALDVADLIDTNDPDHVYSAEEVLDRITDACQGGYKVIILDSVANLTTQAELDNYVADGGVGMGALAQVLSKATKKVVQYAAKYGVLVIFINQIREKIGALFSNPESTPGGRALKHLASIRIKVQKQASKEGLIKIETPTGENLIGCYSYVYILKNRFGKPIEGSIRIPIYYENYFPDAEEVIFDAGRSLKLIKPRLGTFSWGEFKAEGKVGFINKLKEENKVSDLVKEIKEIAANEKFPLPPEVTNYDPSLKVKQATDLDLEEANDTTKKTKVSRGRKSKDSGSGTGDSLAD